MAPLNRPWAWRSGRIWIIGLALVYLSALWGVILRELDHDHRNRLQQAAVDAGNLAHAFERSIDTTVRAVDTALVMLRRDYGLRPDSFDDTVRTVMRTSLSDIALQVGRIDAKGRLVYVMPDNQRLPIDVSDRPHIQVHFDRTGDHLFVGPLLVLRTTGEPALPFTRPILDAEGRTAGVVTILISPTHFSNLYAGLQIGKTGAVELLRDGEVLLARKSPLARPIDPAGMLMPAASTELVAGQSVQVSPIDGVRRVVAERRHPSLPLMLRVGLGEAEVLEQHQRHSLELTIVGGVLSAVLLLANAVLLRLNGRLQQAQQRAAADEERLRGIIENIDVVTWELELPSWRWTYVSPQVERLFGYPAQRWLDEPSFWLDHVHADDRDRSSQFCIDATARGQDHAFEYRFSAQDGRVVWLRDIVRVIRNAQGVPVRLTGVLLDITAQVHAEQELRRERSLLRNLIDTIPDLIFFKDTASVYLGANAAFQRYVGRPGADLTGLTDHDLVEPELAAGFRSRDLVALAAQTPQRSEEWVTYPDGRRVLLDTLKAPFLGDDGKPQGLIGISRDITELKQNQDRLRLAMSVFDVTTEGILVTDAEGLIIAVNPAFVSFTGLTPALAVGRSPDVLRSQRHDDNFYRELRERLARAGRWDGELWVRRRDGSDFPAWLSVAESRDADGRCTGQVFAFSDISRLKRQEQEIWHQANYDSLTGLANRHLFLARLEQALSTARRRQSVVGLMFIDLDRFKWVNDTLGHEAGDAVLVEAGRRLRRCVREVDTVARLGGDEFTIVVEGLEGHEPLVLVVDKVLAALSAPYLVLGTEQHLSGSVGITVFPDDADDASSLVRFADIAMYRAKAAGRGRYAFYSPDMQRDMLARQHTEAALRHALAHGGFVLHYQPIVDVNTLQCRGAEALLRLDGAERGLLEPGHFIAVAEDSGLIAGIGAWIVEQVCAQWRRWLDAEGLALPIAVNVAAVQLRGAELHDALAAALQAQRMPVDQITLDIGETVLVDPTPGAAERLHVLQQMGVRFAIDHYGFGGVNAPLSALQEFRVDAIKIDRALMARCPADEQAKRMVEALVRMARSLGVRSIAVGVETAEQREFLRRIGCELMQGFYCGRAVDASSFGASLRASS